LQGEGGRQMPMLQRQKGKDERKKVKGDGERRENRSREPSLIALYLIIEDEAVLARMHHYVCMCSSCLQILYLLLFNPLSQSVECLFRCSMEKQNDFLFLFFSPLFFLSRKMHHGSRIAFYNETNGKFSAAYRFSNPFI